MAGFMIGLRVSDVYVSHIGLAVGRGAAISVVLVMTVLPQFILLLDRLIDKTSFKLSLPKGDDDGQEDAAVPDPAGDIPAEAPKIPEISAEAVQTAEIPAEAPGTAEVQDDVYSEKSGEEVRQ
jgi:hypothetical protein